MSSLATTINDLPDEFISKLFKYLALSDLGVCSMVSKRWHSIYADFRLDRLLVIGNREFETTVLNNPYGGIENRRCIPKIFRRLLDKPLLMNLQDLYLFRYDLEFGLNGLNRLSQLVNLHIKIDDAYRGSLNLTLPKLKTLKFHYGNVRCPVSIDCPELNELTYSGELANENIPDVKNPETIRKLDTDIFGRKLSPFKNVDCLMTRKFEAICRDTLQSLPNLKELHFVRDIQYVFTSRFHGEIGTLDRMKRTLREFLYDASTLSGPEFRFNFAGFPLNIDRLNFDYGMKVEGNRESVCNEYIYMKNYQLIDPDTTMDFISEINYSDLMKYVVGEFPNDFSKKFHNIKKVIVSDAEFVPDEVHLLRFLSSLRQLKKLELDHSGLSQWFYDRLPATVRMLDELTLGSASPHVVHELPSNFDFINKFFRVSELYINRNLSSVAYASLVRRLAKIEVCKFYLQTKHNRFLVQKRRNSKKYHIHEPNYGFRKDIEAEDPDEIVNFLLKL